MKNNTSWSTFRIFLVAILFVIFSSALVIHPAEAESDRNKEMDLHAQDSWVNAATHQLIVKYKSDTNLKGSYAPADEYRMQMLRSATGINLEYIRDMSSNAHVFRLPARLSMLEVENIARDIATLPDVEYAEPDYIMFPALTPNDSQYGNQWHYFETYGVSMPSAWDFTVGSSNIRIAVIDSGITDHVDLVGRWVGGYDFITDVSTANDGNGRDNNPHDPGNWITTAESASGAFAGCAVTNSTWHGTHVTGIIAAAGNNGIGVAGVNWVSQIVPVRVLGKCGGFTSDIADGMRWAAGLSVSGVPANAHPARVLNLSLAGLGVCSSTYQNAINAVNASGAIIVVAAGNQGVNLNTTTIQPANCNGVIAVAATDREGNRAFYSNYGTTVEISAPGGETTPTLQNGIFSTLNTGVTTPGNSTYGYSAGTSMAAPLVSGVISLMASLNQNLNYAQILHALQSTARAFPAGSNCTPSTCGSGILDAGGALNAIGVPPPTATRTPTNIVEASPTATYTPTTIATVTPTRTASNTPSATFSATSTLISTPTKTATATLAISTTPTKTATVTPTRTASNTPLATISVTSTLIPTLTKTATATLTASTATSTGELDEDATTVGVFRPSNGLLYLKNTNTSGFADIAINYGLGGDYPVVGDWDGDGDDTIGVYRNGSFYLRNSNTIGFADMVFAFGQAGDQPVAGDWDGDSIDTIGIFRPSTGLFMLRNSNSAGSAFVSFFLGNVGDVGIAGDWDEDGDDTTGVFRPSNGIIFLKNTNTSGFADVALNYGIPGDKPVTGDWNNDRTDTIGIYRNGRFYLRNSNTVGFADIVLDLGIPGDMPIAGNWDGLP